MLAQLEDALHGGRLGVSVDLAHRLDPFSVTTGDVSAVPGIQTLAIEPFVLVNFVLAGVIATLAALVGDCGPVLQILDVAVKVDAVWVDVGLSSS